MKSQSEKKHCTRLQTTTTATTLATSRVGGGGGHVLDTANAHAGTGEGTEGRLRTGAGGLGAVTTCGTDLDVECVDAELLAADSDVLSSQHGGVGGGLVTVSLDLHTTGDTDDGFTAAVRKSCQLNIFHYFADIVRRPVLALARVPGWESTRPGAIKFVEESEEEERTKDQ